MLLIRKPPPLLLLLALPAAAHAMTIRAYEPARHDRFTGFPAAPAWNEIAYYESRNYTGVGWGVAATHQQFALVSPLHLLVAEHYKPATGSVIRFLSSTGNTVDRTVAALVNIGGTDLTLATLSSPIPPSSGVAHFPYYDLARESEYNGTVLTVFGASAIAGRGTINRFQNLIEGPEPTRTFRFTYTLDSGNNDDARLQGGDSGSPSFAVVGGRPALVGLHLAIDVNDASQFNYDTFVPHYIDELNAEMASAGYRMTSHSPPASTVSLALTPPSATLRMGNPGIVVLDAANPGAAIAANARLDLAFPAGAEPATVTAPGWIAEITGPGSWSLRKAALDPAAHAAITATWDALPLDAALSATATLSADGATSTVLEISLPLGPSFAAWSAATGDATLVGYAFGTGARPSFDVAGDTASLRFPVRIDAAQRGLAYTLETSTTLRDGSWTESVAVSADTSPTPENPGFLMRTLSLPVDSTPKFFRIRIDLDE